MRLLSLSVIMEGSDVKTFSLFIWFERRTVCAGVVFSHFDTKKIIYYSLMATQWWIDAS